MTRSSIVVFLATAGIFSLFLLSLLYLLPDNCYPQDKPVPSSCVTIGALGSDGHLENLKAMEFAYQENLKRYRPDDPKHRDLKSDITSIRIKQVNALKSRIVHVAKATPACFFHNP